MKTPDIKKSNPYAVFYGDKYMFTIRQSFVEKMQAQENLEEAKQVYFLKFTIIELMKKTENVELLRSLAEDVTLCEFELQRVFNFKPDKSYHRFWELPKCACPYLDNMDSYPSFTSINPSCPLHGRGTEIIKQTDYLGE